MIHRGDTVESKSGTKGVVECLHFKDGQPWAVTVKTDDPITKECKLILISNIKIA